MLGFTPPSDEKILEKGKHDLKFMDLFHGVCVGSYYQKKDGTVICQDICPLGTLNDSKSCWTFYGNK
jgi:hypothetical protein